MKYRKITHHHRVCSHLVAPFSAPVTRLIWCHLMWFLLWQFPKIFFDIWYDCPVVSLSNRNLEGCASYPSYPNVRAHKDIWIVPWLCGDHLPGPMWKTMCKPTRQSGRGHRPLLNTIMWPQFLPKVVFWVKKIWQRRPPKKSKPLAFQPSFWFFTWLWKTDFVELLHILRVTKTAKTQPTQPTAKWQSQGWSDQPRLPGCAWEIGRPTNCRIQIGGPYANPPGSRSNMTCFSTNYCNRDVPRVYKTNHAVIYLN